MYLIPSDLEVEEDVRLDSYCPHIHVVPLSFTNVLFFSPDIILCHLTALALLLLVMYILWDYYPSFIEDFIFRFTATLLWYHSW